MVISDCSSLLLRLQFCLSLSCPHPSVSLHFSTTYLFLSVSGFRNVIPCLHIMMSDRGHLCHDLPTQAHAAPAWCSSQASSLSRRNGTGLVVFLGLTAWSVHLSVPLQRSVSCTFLLRDHFPMGSGFSSGLLLILVLEVHPGGPGTKLVVVWLTFLMNITSHFSDPY